MRDYKEWLTKIAKNGEFYIRDAITYINRNEANISKKACRQAIYRLCQQGWLIHEKKCGRYRIMDYPVKIMCPLNEENDFLHEEEIITHFYKQYNIKPHKFSFMFHVKNDFYVFITTPDVYERLSKELICIGTILVQEENYECEVILPKITMNTQNWKAILFMEMLHALNFHHALSEETYDKIFPLQVNPDYLYFYEQYSWILGNSGRVRSQEGTRIKREEISQYFKKLVLFDHYNNFIQKLLAKPKYEKNESVKSAIETLKQHLMSLSFTDKDIKHYKQDFYIIADLYCNPNKIFDPQKILEEQLLLKRVGITEVYSKYDSKNRISFNMDIPELRETKAPYIFVRSRI
ncbi:MAG: hypothetical protein J6C07_08820 [Lachnospiraceae bacterium]|nr:hypothetical protein [Lachnospiraceae bacterium]